MRGFDGSCLTPIQEFTPEQIRALLKRERVSQSVFAHHLNISKNPSVSGNVEENARRDRPSSLLTLVKRKGSASVA